MRVRALVVTDDPGLAAAVRRAIDATIADAEVIVVDRLGQARDALDGGRCGLVIVGDRLADAPGVDVVRRAHDLDPETTVVMVTEPGNAIVGAGALSAGAADYVEAGPGLDERLRVRIREAYMATRTSARRKRLLELQDALVGEAEPLRSLETVAAATVALLGADAVYLWASTDDGYWHTTCGRSLPVGDASAPASALTPMTGDPGESQAVLYTPKLDGTGPLDGLSKAGVRQVAVGCARAGEGTVATLLAARVDGVWQRDDIRWVSAPCSLLAAAVQRTTVGPGGAAAGSGLPGRRAFERALAIEGDRTQRQRQPISVAILEGDNGAEGSREPDSSGATKLHREAASRLAGSVRSYDFAADLGEGRFGVILPGVAFGAAWSVADRLRASVSGGAAGGAEGAGHRCPTFSCGVGTFPECVARVAELIDCADQALVLARGTGKGQTSVAPRSARDAGEREMGRRSTRRNRA